MKYLTFLFLGFVNTALAQLGNHQIMQQFEILFYTKGEKAAFNFLSKQSNFNFSNEEIENTAKLLKNLPKNTILFTKNQ